MHKLYWTAWNTEPMLPNSSRIPQVDWGWVWVRVGMWYGDAITSGHFYKSTVQHETVSLFFPTFLTKYHEYRLQDGQCDISGCFLKWLMEDVHVVILMSRPEHMACYITELYFPQGVLFCCFSWVLTLWGAELISEIKHLKNRWLMEKKKPITTNIEVFLKNMHFHHGSHDDYATYSKKSYGLLHSVVLAGWFVSNSNCEK